MTATLSSSIADITSRWAREAEAIELTDLVDLGQAEDAANDWINGRLSASFTFRQERGTFDRPEWVGAELLLADNNERTTLTWGGRDDFATLEVTMGPAWTARRIHAPVLAAQLDRLE